MDPILFILGVIGFVIISAISNIAEKKKLRDQEREARMRGEPGPLQGQQEGRRPSMQDWQEQLRRMLNQEDGPGAPPVIHPPPPEPRGPRAQPPPVKRGQAPQRQQPPPPRPVSAMDPATTIREKTAGLHKKAAELQRKVARRVEIIEQKKSEIQKEVKSEMGTETGPMRGVLRKEPARRPVQVRRAIQLIRDQDTIRDAFVASVILGHPKALEEDQVEKGLPLPATS